MFIIYYKLFHFVNNLFFLSPIQANYPLYEIFGNFLKLISDSLNLGNAAEEVTNAVSSTPSTLYSEVAYG
jgi:hypothetical protein